MRFLYAMFIKHNLLPSQYAALNYLERSFVRQSVLQELEDEAKEAKRNR